MLHKAPYKTILDYMKRNLAEEFPALLTCIYCVSPGSLSTGGRLRGSPRARPSQWKTSWSWEGPQVFPGNPSHLIAPRWLSRLPLNHLPLSWWRALPVLSLSWACTALPDWLYMPGLVSGGTVCALILRVMCTRFIGIIQLFLLSFIRNIQNMKLSKLEVLSNSQFLMLFLMNCCRDHCHYTNSMSA